MTRTEYHETIVRLAAGGKTCREIGAAMEVGSNRVYAYAKRYGIEIRHGETGRKGGKDLDHNEALRLYSRGLTDTRISETMGCNAATIWRWRKKKGLPVNAMR